MFTRDIIHKCGEASLGFPHESILGKNNNNDYIHMVFAIIANIITKVAHSHVGIPFLGSVGPQCYSILPHSAINITEWFQCHALWALFGLWLLSM